MKKFSVFFSEHGRGWEQVVIPNNLQDCDYDSLVNWAAWQTRQKGLKGFLVSENPNPFPLLKRRNRMALKPFPGLSAGQYLETLPLQVMEENMNRIAV